LGGGRLAEDKKNIRNKISIAKPNFSLVVETNEKLDKAKRVFEELISKYKK
jgi:hypothetical protein